MTKKYLMKHLSVLTHNHRLCKSKSTYLSDAAQ
jgi:hypothetical protein